MSISFIGGQLNCNYRLASLSKLCVPLYQFTRIKMLYCYVHTLPHVHAYLYFEIYNTHGMNQHLLSEGKGKLMVYLQYIHDLSIYSKEDDSEYKTVFYV